MTKTIPSQRATAALAALALALVFTAARPGDASESWAPVASERLMRLPGDSLEKAVENDFARSSPAERLAEVEERIALKQMTLGDMKRAVERAEDGDIRADLQFELLEEKRAYLDLMKEQQALRRKRAQTKVRLFESILTKLTRSQQAKTPEQAAFIANQKQARERMERTAASVDASLLASTAIETSRYAQEYRKNLNAIDKLMAAIQSHPMNRTPSIAGRPVSRMEYLRQLVAEAQGDLAVVDQESMILGHMAKLVSLDALALAEGITEAEDESLLTAKASSAKSPAEIVDIFTD